MSTPLQKITKEISTLLETWQESKHPRDKDGKFSNGFRNKWVSGKIDALEFETNLVSQGEYVSYSTTLREYEDANKVAEYYKKHYGIRKPEVKAVGSGSVKSWSVSGRVKED